MVVNHDVEAEDLEAHGVVQAVWLTHSVEMAQVRLRRDHSFNYLVFHVLHELFDVAPLRG